MNMVSVIDSESIGNGNGLNTTRTDYSKQPYIVDDRDQSTVCSGPAFNSIQGSITEQHGK